MAEPDDTLALLLTPELGPAPAARLVQATGSAQAALEADAPTIAQALRCSEQEARRIGRAIDRVRASGEVEAERQRVEQAGAKVVTWLDPSYPETLRHIHDPPAGLYVQGRLDPLDGLAVTLVGARQCTQYGRHVARTFASGLAAYGVVVVSGGAMGIDAAAHDGAMDGNGRTLCVFAGGLDRRYPRANERLFDRIASGAGALITEYPMGTPPEQGNFRVRNRIVAGLGLGVVVIEAAERSGSQITARLAGDDLGRPVMAVPGPIDSFASRGCHLLIKDGAALVTCVDDILDALGPAGEAIRDAAPEQARPARR